MQTLNHHVGYSRENECWFVRFYPYQTEQKAKDAINAFTRAVAPVDGLETAWGTPRELLAAFGADDIREGSRAVLGDGIEEDESEDYLEVPVHIFEKMLAKLVTRSEAEAIIAAEWAEKEAWKNASIELDKAQEAIEADNAAKVEQERLRFEGDLDKWMKIIGAGITGYQPEAYALMDLACHDLVKLRSEIAAIAGKLDCEADGDSILNIIREDKADNAALTARVKELEAELNQAIGVIEDRLSEYKTLETQLAAAEDKLDFYSGALNRAVFGFDQIHKSLMSNGPKQASGEVAAFFLAETNTALEAKP